MATKTYTGKDVDVTFDPARCIHCGNCTRRLGAVFDIHRRPWVLPDNAPADDVVAAVLDCPSGALQFVPKDGRDKERADPQPSALARLDGPLYVRGDLRLTLPDGSVATGTRFAFCRCGRSGHMPFCDDTHRKVGFKEPEPAPDKPGKPAPPRPQA